MRVGSISPGMVLTDMITDHYRDGVEAPAAFARVFNVIGDRVETVVPFLVDGMLRNEKPGARIAWLTRRRLYARFLLAPFRRRRIMESS